MHPKTIHARSCAAVTGMIARLASLILQGTFGTNIDNTHLIKTGW